MRGDRLKQLRELHRYTHDDLAALLQIGYASIYRYEAGKSTPDGELLDRMANLFGVSVDYLLGRIDDPLPGNELTEKERAILAALRRGEPYEAIKVIVSDG